DVVGEREVLVDGLDAGALRIARACEPHGLPAHPDRPAVVGVHAGEDLDQRGLARAVVAEQADDLAGKQLTRHVVDGAHRAKVLVHADHLDKRAGHRAFRFVYSTSNHTAAIRIRPMRIWRLALLTSSRTMPLSRLWMMSAPTTAPGTEPAPPASD